MEVSADLCVSFPPVGMLPSFHVTDRQQTESLLGFKERYEMNEWVIMGEGDILLLHTDGLTEHRRGADDHYFPAHLEQKIREVKDADRRRNLRRGDRGHAGLRRSVRRHQPRRHQTHRARRFTQRRPSGLNTLRLNAAGGRSGQGNLPAGGPARTHREHLRHVGVDDGRQIERERLRHHAARRRPQGRAAGAPRRPRQARARSEARRAMRPWSSS